MIKESELLTIIEECSCNGTWRNSDLFETTERILDIIAFKSYEGREKDVNYICNKLKDGFSLFDVENIISCNMELWYFYTHLMTIKEYINQNIQNEVIGQVNGNVALSIHMGYEIRTLDIDTNNLVQSIQIHPNVFWPDGTIRPKWTNDFVTVYTTKKIKI